MIVVFAAIVIVVISDFLEKASVAQQFRNNYALLHILC